MTAVDLNDPVPVDGRGTDMRTPPVPRRRPYGGSHTAAVAWCPGYRTRDAVDRVWPDVTPHTA